MRGQQSLPFPFLFLFLFLLAVVAVTLPATGCGVVAGKAYDGERAAAPDFTLPSVDGGDVSLRQFRGKVVALYMTNL